MQKPKPMMGLRHLALQVLELERCEYFYTALLGMQVEWRPDPYNVYLTFGNDNLALHQLPDQAAVFQEPQRLDHLGFIVESFEEVDAWYHFLSAHQVFIKAPPRVHRDGAKSFYCLDPAGNTVQIIFHPPLMAKPNKQASSLI